MNGTSTHLLIAWFSSVGAAYAAANKFCDERISLMEIFPIGSRGHVIFRGPENLQHLLNDIEKHFDRSLVKAKVITNCEPQILGAYLSTELAPVRESLLIVETEFIGDLFMTAQYAVRRQMGIVDLRLQRGTAATSFIFLTGKAEELKPFAANLKSEGAKTQLIEEPKAHIKNLFSFET